VAAQRAHSTIEAPDATDLGAPECGDWEPMGNNLTQGSVVNDRGGNYVVAIARTPSDTGTIWAGTRVGRLWVSKDANANNPNNVHFYRIDTAATPGRFVPSLGCPACESTRVFMTGVASAGAPPWMAET